MLTLAIPNYNGGRFLARTLESLQKNRPYVRWRFQDAGSTDDSLAVAQGFSGPDDRIVVDSDKGQADALNRAFQAMGGDIVGFINSDDCLAEGAAESVLSEFESPTPGPATSGSPRSSDILMTYTFQFAPLPLYLCLWVLKYTYLSDIWPLNRLLFVVPWEA